MDLEPALTPYKQIISHYVTEINEGRLSPGDSLPAVVELSRTWDMHRTTVYKAIQELQRMGYVTSNPGGSKVADPIMMWQALADLLNLMEARGLDPQLVDTRGEHGVYGSHGSVVWNLYESERWTAQEVT